MEGGHPQAENGEGGEGIAVEALGIDLNDEEQFPALPTQAPVKLNFAQKKFCSPSLAGLHSPHEIYRPAANQHNQLRIKTKIDTGKKEVGEMTIEPPEQRGKAVKRSRVSLARSDPLHPNFNCNLDLNEHNSGDDSTDDSTS